MGFLVKKVMKKWSINLKCFLKEVEPFPTKNSLLLEEVALFHRELLFHESCFLRNFTCSLGDFFYSLGISFCFIGNLYCFMGHLVWD
jgi:hypothetical protein